ncbi:DUF2267 domain-containing protein [Nocardia higoensis]|uniref:DUF2267 domain-containing protein n=1 Tax=Nocardia higoensis TaxID=228599 RepID=A0ABS0D3Q7_9NOCA|nr:DUF2267 domain-containing protein [Nocardia higoensis]MBF6353127.1 DUF2267 domain-containing protein [Nocardia higoensis]
MSHSDDPFAPAVQTAHDWLRAVADALGTDDLIFAHRALRAWMHTVRDRIGVANSAHLTAQLPELLRGIYYEGWVPAHVPVHHGQAAFTEQFARVAGIGRDEVGEVAGAVTAALSELFSPGQVDRVFAVLPGHLYTVLCGIEVEEEGAQAAVSERRHGRSAADHPMPLREQVRALGDAVAALARGLEQLPISSADEDRTSSAAQEAHRILLAEGFVPTVRKR